MNENNRKGRGWHGSSAAHAAAGRKGGLSRGKRLKDNQSAPAQISRSNNQNEPDM